MACMQATYTEAVTYGSWVFEGAGFLLGLLFGSFLNVCISRLPEHRSISKPRSHCPKCLKTIRWYDNVPLLSWALLRAKCRHCGQRISWRYPLVEAGMGLWFLLGTRKYLFGTPFAHCWGEPYGSKDVCYVLVGCTFLAVGFLLIGLMVMDWQTQTLPDAFTLT